MDRKNLLLFVIGGLVVTLGLAFFASPLASSAPDGLERVSIDQGFDRTEKEHPLTEGPLAGYEVRGVQDEGLSTGVAGVIGVAITFGVGMILFGLLRAVRARRGPPDVEGASPAS